MLGRPMDEQALRDLIGEVQRGRLSRRRFVQAMFGLGLSAPIAGHLLAAAGLAQTRPAGPAPARRGGGGPLRLLYWQAPTILNPHLSVGVKDFAGARIFYEPLADFDPEGNLVPFLAAELPTRSEEHTSELQSQSKLVCRLLLEKKKT